MYIITPVTNNSIVKYDHPMYLGVRFMAYLSWFFFALGNLYIIHTGNMKLNVQDLIYLGSLSFVDFLWMYHIAQTDLLCLDLAALWTATVAPLTFSTPQNLDDNYLCHLQLICPLGTNISDKLSTMEIKILISQ